LILAPGTNQREIGPRNRISGFRPQGLIGEIGRGEGNTFLVELSRSRVEAVQLPPAHIQIDVSENAGRVQFTRRGHAFFLSRTRAINDSRRPATGNQNDWQ
jgi:hypothetical protein